MNRGLLPAAYVITDLLADGPIFFLLADRF